MSRRPRTPSTWSTPWGPTTRRSLEAIIDQYEPKTGE